MDGKGRARTAVVTDSMADLPEEWVRALQVHVVPLHVLFRGQSYRDGIDVSHREFFQMMRSAGEGELPRTSHPSPADFTAMYESLCDAGATEILSIHASADISATYQSARLAARDFARAKVTAVDTRLVSMGEGLAVREAVEAMRDGASAQDAVARIGQFRARLYVLFTVETLEYLWKNGRIGRAQAMVGGLLQLKPVLGFDQGVVVPVERVRGRSRSLDRLAKLVEQRSGGRGETLVVAHGDVPEDAEALRDEVLRRCKFDEVVVTTLGATIGAHTGPGTLALFMTQSAASDGSVTARP